MYGERVKFYRELRGMTQDELAKKADIPASSMSRIEKGGRRILFDEAVRISEALAISLHLLAGLEDEATPTVRPKLDEALRTLRALTDELEALEALSV